MCTVAYLQDEATLNFTYVLGKCRVEPIRPKMIPLLERQAKSQDAAIERA